MIPRKANIWWGPPRKFTSQLEERRISWLELFYDLVYVVAISRITHTLAEHANGVGIIDYLYMFTMIYWGWLNGSLYHDLHGSPGIRTRFITLWQMMAVAALVVCLNSPSQSLIFRGTIALMVIQFYITYLWWSVGFYDKNHRQYSRKYIICYSLALGLMFSTLFITHEYMRIAFWTAAILNFLPPFLVVRRLRDNAEEFSLSSSMTERLGLFTIIMFGEGVLGVIQGTINIHDVSMHIWVNFGLGILIVFALWWIFFALLADRPAKPGFLFFHTICIGYIPTLAALGMIGASFSGLLESESHAHGGHATLITNIYGVSLFVFLIGIVFITRLLKYPDAYIPLMGFMTRLMVGSAVAILLFTYVFTSLSLFGYLLLVFITLLVVVIFITRAWYRVELARSEVNADQDG